MRLKSCPLLCVALVCGLPTLARADPPSEAQPLRVVLQYEPLPGCPDVTEFEAIVSKRLSYNPFDSSATQHVLVRVEARNPGISGHVEWRDASGQWAGDQNFPARTADCIELVRTMGLALAVQIHLLAVAGENPPPSDTASPPAAEPARSAPTTEPVKPQPLLRTPPRWRFGAGAGASVAAGMSSSAVALGRLFALAARPAFSFEFAGEVGIPSTTRRADGAGYSQQLIMASLAGCGVYYPWSACGVAKTGIVHVRGRDIDVPASHSGALFQMGIRAAFSPRLGARTFIAARAEGLTTLSRWTVTLDSLPVWTAPRFAGTVGLDLAVLFP